MYSNQQNKQQTYKHDTKAKIHPKHTTYYYHSIKKQMFTKAYVIKQH